MEKKVLEILLGRSLRKIHNDDLFDVILHSILVFSCFTYHPHPIKIISIFKNVGLV